MSNDSFIALISNVALLLAMAFVYDLVATQPLPLDSRRHQVLTGIGIGSIAMAVMLTPWVFEPGIIFDARSILIGISGLFFGFVPTVVAMVLTSALRLVQGGAATVMGISVITASGLIGLTWRHLLKRPLTSLTWRDLLGLGYTVHIVMLVLTFTLPWQTAIRVLSHIALPVLTIYPLGTVALGSLMVNRLKHEQASQTVKDSEVQFRALSEQAAIGVTKTETMTGKYVFVNQRFADIVGYTREELLNMDFHVLTDPGDLKDDLANVERLIRGETREYSMEKRYRRKDGSSIWVNLTVSPLWQKGESPQYLIGLVEDISERKKAEDELQALNTQLEERVRRRTAELEAANKELEAFSYSVSHDLRAPLRSIDGFSQAFLEDFGAGIPEEGRHDLERVRKATQHMGELIDDMLRLSRVTRNEMTIGTVDLSALARDIGAALARDNPGREIDFVVQPGLTARGDRALLRIVLANLLDNAWKFTSHNAHATITFGATMDPDHGTAFFVRDDGVGFDPRYATKLFVAFQRLHAQEQFAGTGIGLATVHRAIRRHGGETWAVGEPDKGATFYFTLPATLEPKEENI